MGCRMESHKFLIDSILLLGKVCRLIHTPKKYLSHSYLQKTGSKDSVYSKTHINAGIFKEDIWGKIPNTTSVL